MEKMIDDLRATISAQDREITRLRPWIASIGRDWPEVLAALRGDPAPDEGWGAKG